MKCPQCGSETQKATIEERLRYACPQCSFMRYEPRKSTDGYHMIVDEIADQVAERGSHETMSVVLANTCFRKNDSKSSQLQLDGWCQEHGFAYEMFDGRDAQKNPQQFVRFSRC